MVESRAPGRHRSTGVQSTQNALIMCVHQTRLRMGRSTVKLPWIHAECGWQRWVSKWRVARFYFDLRSVICIYLVEVAPTGPAYDRPEHDSTAALKEGSRVWPYQRISGRVRGMLRAFDRRNGTSRRILHPTVTCRDTQHDLAPREGQANGTRCIVYIYKVTLT